MNLPEVARQHKPSLYPVNPIVFPNAIPVRNAEAAMKAGALYVAFVTDTGWGGTFLFEGEPLEALRAAIDLVS